MNAPDDWWKKSFATCLTMGPYFGGRFSGWENRPTTRVGPGYRFDYSGGISLKAMSSGRPWARRQYLAMK
jgi:hypothetical protein